MVQNQGLCHHVSKILTSVRIYLTEDLIQIIGKVKGSGLKNLLLISDLDIIGYEYAYIRIRNCWIRIRILSALSWIRIIFALWRIRMRIFQTDIEFFRFF